MEYLGRLDHQVKLRGFRIELGEIESQIRRVDDGVTAVVAVVLGDNPATQRLVAYATPATLSPAHIIAAGPGPPRTSLLHFLSSSSTGSRCVDVYLQPHWILLQPLQPLQPLKVSRSKTL